MNDRIFIQAYMPSFSNRHLQLLITNRVDGKIYVAQEIKFSEVGLDEMNKVVEPTIHLHYEDAQLLMDELWHCGLRPSEGSGSAGSLAATQKHLEDMRRLVFEK